MRQYIRKADVILLIILVIAGLAASASLAASHTGGDTVVIESHGELFATYPLSEDRTIEVPGPAGSGPYNIVEIKDGAVSVTEASCKNQVCVRHGSISRTGESIVCLPNRLVVRVEGKGGGYDTVTS